MRIIVALLMLLAANSVFAEEFWKWNTQDDFPSKIYDYRDSGTLLSDVTFFPLQTMTPSVVDATAKYAAEDAFDHPAFRVQKVRSLTDVPYFKLLFQLNNPKTTLFLGTAAEDFVSAFDTGGWPHIVLIRYRFCVFCDDGVRWGLVLLFPKAGYFVPYHAFSAEAYCSIYKGPFSDTLYQGGVPAGQIRFHRSDSVLMFRTIVPVCQFAPEPPREEKRLKPKSFHTVFTVLRFRNGEIERTITSGMPLEYRRSWDSAKTVSGW